MRPLRSLTAVIAGFGFMATAVMIGTRLVGALLLAVGMFRTYVAASLVVSALAAVLGGWLAGRIAGYAPLQHSAALAAMLAVMTAMTMAAGTPEGQPSWYAPVVGAIGVAGVLAGGWLRRAAAEATGT